MKLSNYLRTRPGLNTALGIAFATIAGLLLLGYLSTLLKAKRGDRFSMSRRRAATSR